MGTVACTSVQGGLCIEATPHESRCFLQAPHEERCRCPLKQRKLSQLSGEEGEEQCGTESFAIFSSSHVFRGMAQTQTGLTDAPDIFSSWAQAQVVSYLGTESSPRSPKKSQGLKDMQIEERAEGERDEVHEADALVDLEKHYDEAGKALVDLDVKGDVAGILRKVRKMKRRPSMEVLVEVVQQPSLLLQVMIENSKDISEIYNVSDTVLGKGAYGSVKKATVKATGAKRAVKCISKGSENSTQQQRAKEEVEITKQLDHPNIVKLYELFEGQEHLYIVLELCTGGTIHSVVYGAGKLSDGRAAKLMVQLMRAVYYLHRNSVCHRDIKPENCLLVNHCLEANNLRLSDFGLSCKFVEGEMMTRRVGTLRYMSPEVLDKNYTHMADVWSCGILMYYLLCGYTPFTGKDDDDIKAKIKSGQLNYPAADWVNVASETMILLEKMVTVNPAKRIQLQLALSDSWIKKHNVDCNTGQVEAPWVALISNLLQFRSLNKLKRTALHIIASMVDEEVLAEYTQAYVTLDRDHDGVLSVEELRQCLNGRCSLPEVQNSYAGKLLLLDEEDLDMIYQTNRGFSYTEFLAACLDRERCCQQDACWAAFVILDANNDGKISVKELSELNVLGKLTPKELKELVELFDQNRDGELDFQEFMVMMRSTDGMISPMSPTLTPMSPCSPSTPSGQAGPSPMSASSFARSVTGASSCSTPSAQAFSLTRSVTPERCPVPGTRVKEKSKKRLSQMWRWKKRHEGAPRT